MSKRCELQKEYYKKHGNYKGDGKYIDNYVLWLEGKILKLEGLVKNNVGLADVSRSKAQEYAEFCVECDRNGLKLLEYDGWIKLN